MQESPTQSTTHNHTPAEKFDALSTIRAITGVTFLASAVACALVVTHAIQ